MTRLECLQKQTDRQAAILSAILAIVCPTKPIFELYQSLMEASLYEIWKKSA